jgi:hypothetical protein
LNLRTHLQDNVAVLFCLEVKHLAPVVKQPQNGRNVSFPDPALRGQLTKTRESQCSCRTDVDKNCGQQPTPARNLLVDSPCGLSLASSWRPRTVRTHVLATGCKSRRRTNVTDTGHLILLAHQALTRPTPSHLRMALRIASLSTSTPEMEPKSMSAKARTQVTVPRPHHGLFCC